MNVGLCTISDKERSVEEVIELAGETGYDGVEIWGKDHVGDGSPERGRQIAETADEHGLEIPVYGSYLRCGTDEFDAELTHELEIAEQLGVDLIRVWAGRQEYSDHDDDHWDAIVADLDRLTERAATHGVDVTIEKHVGTVTNTREGARRLIEVIDDDRCGLNYQPGFSIPEDELERESETLAPLSNNIHLQAVRERGERNRCPLAEAFYDLETVLEPFLKNGNGNENGFDGYANVEFVTDEHPYHDAIADDLRYVRSVTE